MIWEKAGGEGIWTKWENSDTGQRSYEEHIPKVVKKWCASPLHKYRIRDVKKRIAVCDVCGAEIVFVVGKHTIDGDRVKIT